MSDNYWWLLAYTHEPKIYRVDERFWTGKGSYRHRFTISSIIYYINNEEEPLLDIYSRLEENRVRRYHNAYSNYNWYEDAKDGSFYILASSDNWDWVNLFFAKTVYEYLFGTSYEDGVTISNKRFSGGRHTFSGWGRYPRNVPIGHVFAQAEFEPGAVGALERILCYTYKPEELMYHHSSNRIKGVFIELFKLPEDTVFSVYSNPDGSGGALKSPNIDHSLFVGHHPSFEADRAYLFQKEWDSRDAVAKYFCWMAANLSLDNMLQEENVITLPGSEIQKAIYSSGAVKEGLGLVLPDD